MKQVQEALEKSFYKDVYNDPERAKDLKTNIQSVMHILGKEQDEILKDRFETREKLNQTL